MKIKYFDFFSGIGGFKSAMEQLNDDGFETEHIGFCEIERNATRFYKNHYSCENVQYIDDVETIKTKIKPNGTKLQPFNFLLAGFPCQSFSNIGYRRGIEDERGKLFYNILHLLEEYEPDFFVLENVQKLSTIKKGELLDEMTKALKSMGYNVHVWDLIASDYGVPQKRKRIFFAGIKNNLCSGKILAPPPPINLSTAKYPTVWHLLEREIDVDDSHVIPTKTRETVLYKNPKWQGNVDIDNAIARPITASMAKWHRANQDNYYSETYLTQNDPYYRPYVDLKNEKIRRITPLEGFRIQGFEDKFDKTRLDLKLSYSATYKLIGNAVPVPMAKAVIKHLLMNYSMNKL